MKISGLEKLTLLDYPNKLACIVFTQGCNFKCPFCQNSDLIKIDNNDSTISEEEVLAYLNKRKNVLDGVVITGGEPTIQKDLKEFIKKIVKLDLKVKLDTNGFNPIILKNLIDEGLLDYVAMDIKNDFSKYAIITGKAKIKLDNIKESIKIIKNSGINYEFRTTIMKEHHTIDDIKAIIKIIGVESKYFLQNFKDSENVIDKNLHGFSEIELRSMEEQLKKIDNNVVIRGL